MIAKTIEIRDRATFIPALAVKLEPSNEADRYLLARAGFGRSPLQQREYVLLCQLSGGNGRALCDPYDWSDGARTYPTVHQWLIDHFDEIESGAVVDAEFIAGETQRPKISESAEEPV